MEIERKFLVKDHSYRHIADSIEHLSQAYLNSDPEATVRIRISDGKAWITIKGLNHGIVRQEWEYEIPRQDALLMMKDCKCSGMIDKTRYHVGRWEIDEFHGHLEGLVIAEIELTSPNENFLIPDFIGREVSGDARYYNSCLANAECRPNDE